MLCYRWQRKSGLRPPKPARIIVAPKLNKVLGSQSAAAEVIAGEGGEKETTFELFCGGFECYC
jgi:hypothetical protein